MNIIPTIIFQESVHVDRPVGERGILIESGTVSFMVSIAKKRAVEEALPSKGIETRSCSMDS